MADVENIQLNFQVNNNVLNQTVNILQNVNNQMNRVSNSINKGFGFNGLQMMGQSIQNIGNSIKNLGTSMTENITKPVIGGLAMSVKSAMEFEKQLDFTGAKANATAKEMGQLKDQAIKLGIATKYTSAEVAKGQEEMIKAGRTVKQVFDEMDDVLNLAAAGNIEVAQAAEMSSNVLNMFSMQGVTAAHVANQFAGAANASAIDCQELYTTLSYVGPVAASLGISLEDVSAAVGVLGNNAIKGSKAGTGLRQFLMRLQPASDKAEGAMRDLGLITKEGANQFYDASGKMKNMSDIVNILKTSLTGLTDQKKQDKLKVIFGLIASPTVNTLVNQNTSAINDMKDAIGKITAEEVAARQMDNLAGTIDIFKSTVEAISMKIGDLFIPVIRGLLQGVNKLLEGFANLPSPVIAVGVAFALVLAAIGPIVTIVGTLIAAMGGVITVFAGVAAAISFIGWPIIISSIVFTIAAFEGLIAIVTSYISSTIDLVNATIPVKDTFILLKNLLSGDMKKVTETLVKKFDMTKDSAKTLTKTLADMGEKAKILWDIFSKNLGTVFDVISKDIFRSIGAFDSFNNSTDKTKGNVTGAFKSMIKPVQDFINKIYKLADSLGLVSAEAKLNGDKTAAEYVKLNANVDKSLSQMLGMQETFANQSNNVQVRAAYDAYNNTKKALDSEYKLVEQQLNKKQDTELKAAEELYKNTTVLTDKQKQEGLAKIRQYYEAEKTDLKAKNARILEIESEAIVQKRKFTEQELIEMSSLRKQVEDKNLQLITESKAKQKVILEQAMNETRILTKQESLELVVETNNKYNQVVATAKKARDDNIATAINQRDVLGFLNTDQANKIIAEANRQYNKTVDEATKTKNDTLRIADEKCNGELTKEDLKLTKMDEKQQNLKKLITGAWEELKIILPPIIEQLGAILITAFEKSISNAVSAKVSKWKNEMAEQAKAFTTWDSSSSSKSSKKSTPKHAIGTRYSLGGMALVGEQGAELVNLPKGSQVYNNQQTRSIMNNSNSKSININYSGGTTTQDKNNFTNMLRAAGVY